MNVYEATQKRLETIFKEFDNVYVSFSGGKDSGVMLNLCIDFVKKNYPDRKLGVFHIDYEAQYQYTTDYVLEIFEQNKDVLEVFHCCLPIKAQCATSMYQQYWTPWDIEKKDIWVRDMPENAVKDLPFFKQGMWDYDFQVLFSTWYHEFKKASKTACLVGIRTQESLNRWRAIHSDKNYKNYKGLNYTKEISKNVYNAYPIYDWVTEDIWICNQKNKYLYNKLYDIYHQAGLTINQMRVASPFNDYATESLKLYRVIDPNNWGKMVGRVNGVNFTGIYGGTTAMGWKSIKLPKGHTWETYMYFLLSTLPEKIQNNYLTKLNTSIEFWKTKGGCLSLETINKLKDLGIDLKVKESTNYNTNKIPVCMDYLDEVDIEEFKEIPTYKRMCICIMKNDHLCKYMGFSQTKKETQIRQNVIEKYKKLL